MPSSIRRPCYGSGFRVKGSLTGSTRVYLGFQPEHGILRLKTLNPTYTVVGGEGVPESLEPFFTYLWLVGNGGMVVIVVIIVPHSSIPY